MPLLQENIIPKVVNKVSLGGMNTFSDPKDIADDESADILNMVFENGIIKPRGGSLLYRSKPTGEQSDPFQMLTATTSDGLDYLIVNYGYNFYLDDTINNQWIWLNPTGAYIPDNKDIFYGSTPWNYGITDDRFYFCNGIDPVIKWSVALNTLQIAAAAADTTLTLNDAVRFPQSGKVVIKGTSGEFILEYKTKSGNVLNLKSGNVGQIVPLGSSVTVPLVSVPEIDQSQGITNDSTKFGELNATTKHNQVAQSFVAGKDTIKGFIFNKQSDTGEFIDDVKFTLRADLAGSPATTSIQEKTITNADWKARNLGLQGINFQTTKPISFLPSPLSSYLDDMTQSGNFNGTIDSQFRIIIDGVSVPESAVQTFIPGGGSNNLDDGVFNDSTYLSTFIQPGVENEYRITMIADATVVLNDATAYTIGETIVGSVSNSSAVIVYSQIVAGVTNLGVVMTSPFMFTPGEQLTGSTTPIPAPGVGLVYQALFQNWFSYSKNGTVINLNITGTPHPINPFNITVITLTDSLTFQATNFFGHSVGDTFKLNIVSYKPDTFAWYLNDLLTPVASGVLITGSDQSLTSGISIKFANKIGHTLTDSWDFFYQYDKVTIGNTYWLVFETTKNNLPSGDTNNHPNIGINTAGGYASGTVKYDNTADGWTTIAGIDLYFYILNTPFIPRGKILKKSQGRLFLFNSIFNENAFNYSQINDAENFTINDTANTGGFYTVFHGKGGIVDVNDFGEYFLIEKQNDLLKCMFLFDATNTAFIVQVTPVISGESIGPVSNATALNYMNELYYVTEEEGIISFTPEATGGQTTSGLSIISEKINNYVTQVLNFQNSRCAGWNQKLFWLNAVPLILGLPADINNGVIMYDIIRKAWTRFDNWQAVDIKPINNILYYLSLNDGAVYKCFVDYQDAVSDNPLPYNASFTTKRFDLDTPFALHKEVYVYLQGQINLSSRFYVDILYNENGYLGKQTYLIDGSNATIVQQGILGGLGVYPFGIPVLGGFNLRTMQNAVNPAFFRVYLECSQAFRPHNIQIVCYSQEEGSEWGVSNISILCLPEKSIPVQLVLSPTDEPPIII